MNDNEIKQLLENIEVQPSARCWEAIDGALGAAGTSAAAATKGAAQATRHLSSTAIKAIIAGSAATFVAAGALVTALLLSHPTEPTTTPAATTTETSAITPEPAATTALLPDTSTSANTPAISQHSPTITHENPTENTLTEVTATSSTTETTTPTEPNHSPAAVTQSTTSTPTTLPQHTNTQTSSKNTPKAATPTTQPASSPQPVPQTEDPVLAGRDDLDFAPPVTIEIPNVITPNGDGYNDLFIIKGIENCEKSKLIVRSKSGGVVLQISDYQNNWDAQNAPDGTYFYQLYYTIHGIEEVRTGTLTIIR